MGKSENSADSLRRVNRQLRMLSDCNHALIRCSNESELLATICSEAVEVGGYRFAWVGMAEADTRKTVRPVAFAGAELGYLASIDVTWSESDSGCGPMGSAIRTGKPSVFQNTSENPLFAPWRAAAVQRGYASACGLPLIAENATLGALGIYSDEPQAFDTEEVSLLLELASDLAFGLAVLRTRAERRRAVLDLQVRQERFERLLHNSNDVIATVDEAGILTSASGPTERLFGYRTDEILGRNIFLRVHPDDVDVVKHAFADVLEHPDTLRRAEYRLLRKEGAWIHLEAVGTNRLQDDVVRAVVLNIRDISDRKQGEEERSKLQNQLQQAMKMEAMGRLAGGIAHDFNNMITVISGNVELAKLSIEDEHPALHNLEEVVGACKSATSLTRQLLAFSRRQIIEPQLIQLNELVANLKRMLMRLIGEHIRFETQLSDDLDSVLFDPGQLEQALVNLVVNACDAMPEGGTVSIETSKVILDTSTQMRYPPQQPGCFVLLSVTDNGHGMSEEVRERVFEPFFTTKPKGKGTGLGLATIYGAVRQAGGTIAVQSTLGEGTSFKIYLPCAHAVTSPVLDADVGLEVPAGRETILFVEDDPSVRELGHIILKRLGYEVLVAADGETALQLSIKHGGRIDLLVTDVVLPGISGRTVAERLARARPGTKILFTSGYTDDLALRYGTTDNQIQFISKPYTVMALARKLREVLGIKLG